MPSSRCPQHESPKVYWVYCVKRPVYFTQYIFMQYPTPHISPLLDAIKLFSRLVPQCTFFPQTSSSFSRTGNVSWRNVDLHRIMAACWELHSMIKGFQVLSQNLREGTVNFVVSVCPFAWNSWARTGRIFIKFYIWVFF